MVENDKEKWTRETIESTDTVKKEVDRILGSEDPALEVAAHLDNIIAGEQENKISIFDNLLSGRRRNPKKKQIIVVKGTEGGGKTTLLRIADLFNVKDVGRFSEHALDYADLSGYDVLRLKEIGAMDEEKQGVSTLKFLSADDRGYTVEITIREKETGEFITKEYRIPPITLITSTTKVILDPQFDRRAWIYNADETEEQTKRVQELKAKKARQEYEKSVGLRAETDEEWSLKVLKELVKTLEDVEVIVPFPLTLFSILDSRVLRVRGDYDKLLSLIENDGVLLQRTLPSAVFTVDGKKRKVVFATAERTIQVLQRVAEPLAGMMLQLEKRTRALIEVLESLQITKNGSVINKEDRNNIARRLGRGERTIRNYLYEWAEHGYVSEDFEKGTNPKTHTLLHDLSEIKCKSAGILEKLRFSNILIADMRKEAQNWLKGLLEKTPSGDIPTFTKIIEEYTSPPTEFSNKDLSNIQAPQLEISPSGWKNAEIPTFPRETPPEPPKTPDTTEVAGLREGSPATTVISTKPDPFETRKRIIQTIADLTKRIGYGHLANIAYETGIPEAELKNRLRAMERDGSIVQFQPSCWRLVRE